MEGSSFDRIDEGELILLVYKLGRGKEGFFSGIYTPYNEKEYFKLGGGVVYEPIRKTRKVVSPHQRFFYEEKVRKVIRLMDLDGMQEEIERVLKE